MVDETKIVRPRELKDTDIERPKTSSSEAQMNREGILTEDGRAFVRGSAEKNANDTLWGSDFDDIMHSGDTDIEQEQGQESFYGADGFDTVILPGSRHDYVAVPVTFELYPSNTEASDFSQNNGFLYGSRIALEEAESGEMKYISNAELIVFAGDIDANPKQIFTNLNDMIANGDVETTTPAEIISLLEDDMSDEQKMTARLESTVEFMRVIEEDGFLYQQVFNENGIDAMPEELYHEAIEASRAAHPDIMNEPTIQPSAPASEVTANARGLEVDQSSPNVQALMDLKP